MDPNETPTSRARFARVSARPRATGEAGGASASSGPTGSDDGRSSSPAPVRGMHDAARPVRDGTPTLADHWSVLRRRRNVIAICTLVAVTLAGLWIVMTPATYTSEATVVIRPIASDAFQDTRIEDVGAPTEAVVVGSTVVADIAARRLNLAAAEADGLRKHVSVTNPAGTLLLRISFTASSAAKARAGAQAFAEAYLEHRRASADGIRDRALARNATRRTDLERQLAAANAAVAATQAGTEARTVAEVTRDGISTRIADIDAAAAALESVVTDPGQVIRPASLPTAASGPPAAAVLLAAAVLGLFGGVVVALLRERTDRRIPSRRTLAAIAGVDPLVEVPAFAGDAMAAVADPQGPAAGAFRRLRVAVWPQRGDGPRRIVVTSPTSTDAADVVAGNLAITLARAGWSTLLAWTVPDDPAAPPRAGLVPFGAEPTGRPLRAKVGADGLSVLVLPVAEGAGAAAAERLAERLDGYAYDVEIVVAPALVRAPDAIEASPLSDAVLLVVDIAEEHRVDLDASLEALDSVGAPVEGVVAYAVPKGW